MFHIKKKAEEAIDTVRQSISTSLVVACISVVVAVLALIVSVFHG
jgi:hypothetical protein